MSLILAFNLSKAQYTYEDIFKCNKLYFYGYDFTHYTFVEQKRMEQGEKMKGFAFELIEWMNTNKPEYKYANWLKKDTVIFDQQSVTNLNTKIEPKKIMSYIKTSIPKDSLQNMINQYDTKGKSGIGLVQIIECIYRPKKEVYVWFVFFDIKTQKILDAYESINHDADSYHGLAEYWGVGMSCNMGDYGGIHYKPALKAYKKSIKKK